MPGPPTFIIAEVAIRPGTPETWSFSALTEFEECPMRWALSRTAIPCFGGPVPQKPNRGSVEGTLLHQLLQCLKNHRTGANKEAFRPRRTLLGLVAAWAKNNANNPRIDSITVAGQVRIEEILRAFREACAHIKRGDCQGSARTPSASNRAWVVNGAESWLRDPESKLCGRADLITAGQIVDFKTGERSDDDTEQIVFYAALYLALTGRSPTALRLVYTAKNEVLDVPIPALSELESVLDGMRRRAALAEQQVSTGELPAKPEPMKCMYCHVRGLCHKYWQSLAGVGQFGNCRHGSVIDYAPTIAATIESAAFGVYLRDKVAGIASVLHVPQAIAGKAGEHVTGIRIIALRTIPNADNLQFVFTQASEVYVNQTEI